MSTQTDNLHLVKPADGEIADIGVINSNMDIIDGSVLPLSGGTMTGNLELANTAPYINIKDTNLETNVTTSGESDHVAFRDKNGTILGRVNHWITSGIQYMRYITMRPVSGTNKYNILNLGLDASGNAVVRIEGTGVAAAWRNAIGATMTLVASTQSTSFVATTVDLSNASMVVLQCCTRYHQALATTMMPASEFTQYCTSDSRTSCAIYPNEPNVYQCVAYYSGGKVYLKAQHATYCLAKFYRIG